MANNQNAGERRLQFSIRDALAVTIIVALAFGWHASTQRAEREMARLARQQAFAGLNKQGSDSRERLLKSMRTSGKTAQDGIFSGVDLSGAILRSATIDGRNNAFQGTVFNHCDLRDASLTGSFQGAWFDNADLINAKLTGGSSSFQLSSFVNANLTGATLVGGPSSCQGSTFQGATLIGTRIVCSGASFQAVNIDAANFRHADLSTLEAESLKSCYFKTPPTYDDKTRFPKGFDASLEGWRRVE